MPAPHKTDLASFRKAIEAAQTERKKFLDRFHEMRREYLGNAGQIDETPCEERPVNIIQRTHDQWVPTLAPRNVGFKVNARRAGMDGQAYARTLRLNRVLKQNAFPDVDYDVVSNAYLGGEGYYKVDLVAGLQFMELEGEQIDRGQVVVSSVDPADVLWDVLAKSWAQRSWHAVRSIQSRQQLAESGLFDYDAVMALPLIEQERDEDLPNLNEAMLRKYPEDADLSDSVEVWEVMFYQGGKCLSAVAPSITGMKSGRWLREPEEYMGLEGGPLVRVCLRRVPGMAPGIAPARQIASLHLQIDKLFKKLMRRANRAKNGIVTTSADMAEDIKQQGDGFVLTHEADGATKEIKIEGPTGEDWQVFQAVLGQANETYANMQAMGGSAGTTDKTATEAMQLQGNLMALVNNMNAVCKEARGKVAELVGRWTERQPLQPETFMETLRSGLQTSIVLDESTIEGSEDDFEFVSEEVDVTPVHPDMALARIGQIAQAMPAVVMTNMQIFGPDVAARVAGAFARASRVPDLVKAYDGVNQQALEELAMQRQMEAEQAGMMKQQNDAQGKPTPGKKPPGGPGAGPGGPPRQLMGQMQSDMAPAMAGGGGF